MMRATLLALLTLGTSAVVGLRAQEVSYPPRLPDGKTFVTDQSPDCLKAPAGIRSDVKVAKMPPRVDFLYFPGQDYPGKPWSNWGDSLAADGKYYASIGDHLAPAGNAFVYEYDPAKHELRRLTDVRSVLKLPEGHYVPGKIHSRLDRGKDGWLYFSTHRGSTRVTTDQYHYEGDWILRLDPKTGRCEVVAHGPVPKHCIPCSILDPERMIFYGGTAPGVGNKPEEIHFFAFDIDRRKNRISIPNGPKRCIALARSTGRVYYNRATDDALMRYDPDADGPPVALKATLGMRAASEETADGKIYAVSTGQGGNESVLSALSTKDESVEVLGPAAVGGQQYITSLDVDPTGRYIYYVPGAHGGADRDGTPLVQYDVKKREKKVIAFLHPFYQREYGCALKGTYSMAVDPTGERVYITWNANRANRNWDTCALTVVHVPASERQP